MFLKALGVFQIKLNIFYKTNFQGETLSKIDIYRTYSSEFLSLEALTTSRSINQINFNFYEKIKYETSPFQLQQLLSISVT